MSKINKYDEFVKVEEKFGLSMDSFKGLMNKVRSIIPKDKIKSFIKDNRAEVERVKDMITNDDGDVDYTKAINFAKKEVKK